MKTHIDPKFQPVDRTYSNLAKHGAIPEFVDTQIDDFIAYWLERAEDPKDGEAKKKSWQATFQRWVRLNWFGKAGRSWEKFRHNRKDSGSNCDDLFNGSAPIRGTPEVRSTTTPEVRKGVGRASPSAAVKHSPIPGEGETMSQEQAFNELRRQGVI